MFEYQTIEYARTRRIQPSQLGPSISKRKRADARIQCHLSIIIKRAPSTLGDCVPLPIDYHDCLWIDRSPLWNSIALRLDLCRSFSSRPRRALSISAHFLCSNSKPTVIVIQILRRDGHCLTRKWLPLPWLSRSPLMMPNACWRPV